MPPPWTASSQAGLTDASCSLQTRWSGSLHSCPCSSGCPPQSDAPNTMQCHVPREVKAMKQRDGCKLSSWRGLWEQLIGAIQSMQPVQSAVKKHLCREAPIRYLSPKPLRHTILGGVSVPRATKCSHGVGLACSPSSSRSYHDSVQEK